MVHRGARAHGSGAHLPGVSILVLLDGAPRLHGLSATAVSCGQGFNPCSPGWCPRATGLRAGAWCQCAGVSILVLLDGAPRATRPRERSGLAHEGFQSLFSWMVPRGRPGPISAALLLETRFQSLFSWMVPRGRLLRRQPRPANPARFQSLFSWMVPRGDRPSSRPRQARPQFQSLFSWMVPRGRPGWRQRMRILTARFQSLFSWIERGDAGWWLDTAHK